MAKNSKKRKTERAKGKIKIEKYSASAVKRPDFAARRKKAFDNGVLNAVEDFLE
jgi:hypothetical protein